MKESMQTKKQHNWLSSSLKWLGCATILLMTVYFSLWLYKNGLEDTTYTNNYTTSVLYSDSLATASGAAPWALMSLNWFLCRSGIKHWIRFIKNRFE